MDIKRISLRQYVLRRNGVPLGHKDSLQRMLINAFGAGSFAAFWRYWNPIWGYYLSRKIMTPLSKRIPQPLAVIMTFAVSGLLHDIAVSLIKLEQVSFFTHWFTLMGIIVVITGYLKLSYGGFSFWLRACINLSFILLAFLTVTVVNSPQ